MKPPRFYFCLILGLALLAFSRIASAQWETQSIVVKPGWTAVYLNVDASYQVLDQLVGSDSLNPIVEVWLWKAPASTAQYLANPASPLSGGADWAQWSRPGVGAPSTFNRLIPNAAYLVHSVAATNYTWRIKGKPIAPNYTWTTTGLNFIGFQTPTNNPPPIDTFLSLAPAFAGAAEIYQYIGGDLRSSNPSQVIALHATRVTRGQAFWIRSGSVFNDYFGPFQVSVSSPGVIDLGAAVNQYSFYLRNSTASNLVVTARLIPSETPPAGQAAIVGAPPVLVRGNLNSTNLTYAYTDLSGSGTVSWTLKPKGQPGSEIPVVIGVNRAAMTAPGGSLYAGILRFTDAFNLSQIDVPVSAQSSSAAGLWMGKALMSQVGNYLKTYQLDVNNRPVISSNGNYIVTGIKTNLGPVPQAFPQRLILHNDGTNVFLLQRIFYGLNRGSNIVVSTQESALDPAHLDTARRISAANFPWSSTNLPWSVTGQLTPGGNLTATVQLAYDDQASNPFLHTYHPDHDNLDGSALPLPTKLPQGSESYGITRAIKLNLDPPGNDFVSRTVAGQSLSGTYSEAITVTGLGGATRTFNVGGVIFLNRISTIATLTRL